MTAEMPRTFESDDVGADPAAHGNGAIVQTHELAEHDDRSVRRAYGFDAIPAPGPGSSEVSPAAPGRPARRPASSSVAHRATTSSLGGGRWSDARVLSISASRAAVWSRPRPDGTMHAGSMSPRCPSISAAAAPPAWEALSDLVHRADGAARRLEEDLSLIDDGSARTESQLDELHECIRVGTRLLRVLRHELERLDRARTAPDAHSTECS